MSISPDRAVHIVAELVSVHVTATREEYAGLAPGEVLDILTNGAGRMMCELLLAAVLAGEREGVETPQG